MPDNVRCNCANLMSIKPLLSSSQWLHACCLQTQRRRIFDLIFHAAEKQQAKNVSELVCRPQRESLSRTQYHVHMFPAALGADSMYLLRVLIGSLFSFRLLWLARWLLWFWFYYSTQLKTALFMRKLKTLSCRFHRRKVNVTDWENKDLKKSTRRQEQD